jgi:NADH-ubiquinone oxidoreductase chain 5
MLILIVLLPLFGFFSASLFGRFLGIGACYLTVLNIFISFSFSCFLLYKIIFLGISHKIILTSWIYLDSLKINWGFLFDSLTSIMLFIVTFISFLVHLYSLEYMQEDPHLNRFMSFLSLFTFFMLILVTADNFLQMFVGWEGVGLSSYLLINFWFTRIQANKAAIKAMVVNRIGDLAILVAFFFIFYIFSTLDYDLVFSLSEIFSIKTQFLSTFFFSYIDVISLLIFFGAVGKSAQFGLHTWLPDAMEGPTPVSALIHAATMVTAGVFLLIRCSFLLEFSSISLNFIMIIGALTTFFASSVGLFQNDIKKIIAYSTCSQLGYMIFSCGLSSYDVAIFHLSNHAFFKALLFLGAGSIIHGLGDEQDIRKMGGLKDKLPISYAIMLIGSFALMGFPFLSGFFSKDVILEVAYAKYTLFGQFSYFFGLISVFFTSFYSTRLLFLTFLSEPNGSKKIIFFAHESGLKIIFPLILLCFFSVFIGFLSQDLFIGFGSDFWKNSIFILPSHYLMVDIEFLNLFFKLLPFFFSLLGFFFSYFFYLNNFVFFKFKTYKIVRLFFFFFNKKWYLDKIYNNLVSTWFFIYGFKFFYKEIDRGLIEYAGPFNIIQLISKLNTGFLNIHQGTFFHSMLFFSFSIFFIFLFYFLFIFFFNFFETLFFLIFVSFFLNFK